jgi:hypothetical protein
MAREKPMMSVEIFDSILKLSVRSFVKFFDYVGTGRFGPPVMRFHVFNKHSETLRQAAKL